MSKLNRRNWIKASSLVGVSTAMSPLDYQSIFSDQLQSSTETADDVVRLSSNENPYGPSRKVRDAMINDFDKVCRYPRMYYKELVDMLAIKHNVSADHIVLTAGSTEGLKMAGLVYGGEGSNIVAADPVFLALQNYAEHFGAYIHKVPVTKEMTHDLDAMESRITQATRLVYVCNPNNPTSALEPADKLESFCKLVSKRSVVFSDEAYFDYIEDKSYPTMINLVKQGQNVIVARTFSKVYGLAGIRIGYLIARPDIINRLGKSSMAGPNVLAVTAAIAALKDEEFYNYSIEQNRITKKMMSDTLDELGLPYVDSACNFLFYHSGQDISQLYQSYMSHGVKVGRPFPPMLDWCRVSMGTIDQVERLCSATRKIFS